MLLDIKKKDDRKKTDNRQTASYGLEGKRTDVVHTDTLRDEGRTPDECSQEQDCAALKLFFHIITTGQFITSAASFQLQFTKAVI